MEYFEKQEDRMVDAIEEGRIVRVTESYAKHEGLAILRKPSFQENKPQVVPQEKANSSWSSFALKESLMKTPSWKEKQVISELVPNFHWQIRVERKKRGLTKAQLAKAINESEENIKLVEFGKLPSEDFVLVNKLQKYLNINLRKDGKNFTDSAYKMLNSPSTQSTTVKFNSQQSQNQPSKFAPAKTDSKEITGSDVDISASDLL